MAVIVGEIGCASLRSVAKNRVLWFAEGGEDSEAWNMTGE